MIPPPPPPPPPPKPCNLHQATTNPTKSCDETKNSHPLVGGAEPEMHSALMAELREFAKVR